MILAIDIGNTSIKFALLKNKCIIKERVVVGLERKKVLSHKVVKVIHSFNRVCSELDDVIICSVVPKHLKLVESLSKRILKKKPLVIGRNLRVPIKNKYSKPKQVGADRLVGAYAAKCLYKEPVIIIDFGTAITFDVVNERGEYEGGVIVPGIRLSAESLFKKTALLPKILNFKAPRSVIGKNTQDSILSGIFYGYGALSNGLIDQIEATMKKKPRVIVTGGHTRTMKRLLSKRIKIDEALVIKGICLTYKAQKR
jgi:type III pantothenate kinase